MMHGWKCVADVKGWFRCDMNDPNCIRWSVIGKGSSSYQELTFDSFQKS